MKRLFISISVILWTAVSQASPSLNLWQAWELALANDPIYAAQRANARASQEQINQARAVLLPSIDAVGSLQSNDTRRASTLAHSTQGTQNTWQLRLSQPLLHLSALARFERSQHLAAAALLESELAKQDLMLRVANTYFEVLAAEDSLNSLEAQQRAVQLQREAAHHAFELGGATITDTLEAQSRLDLLSSQLITAKQLIATRKKALDRMTGQNVVDLAALNDAAHLPSPEPANAIEWQAQADQHNLSIASSQLAVQAQQALLKAERREHAPTLSLQARSGAQSNVGIHGPQTSPRALDSTIGIELAIPLYKGGAISSRVRENTSLVQQRQYEYENARRQAQEAVQVHFLGVMAGLSQVAALQAAERSSAASVEANQIAYSIGVRITIDVLNAQQQLYETQRALAQARYTTLMHGLQLKHYAGQLDEQDLAAINQLLLPL